MNQVQIFNHQKFGQVRTIEHEGKILFVGVDVAKALEYTKPSQAVINHCKGILKLGIPSQGGIQETNVIPEGDVFRLIVKAADQSRNPEIKAKAEEYEKWIFDEVLPAIRKEGTYTAPTLTPNEAIALSLKQTADLMIKFPQLESKIEQVERKVDEQITLNSGEQRRLQKAIATKVYEIEQDEAVRPDLFRQLHREIKDRWGVASYKDVKHHEFQSVLRYVEAWVPKKAS